MANERTEEQESARQQLIDSVKEWREAVCFRPSVPEHDPSWVEDQCDGDNHLRECPVERARQDILAAHNNVEQLRAG